MSFTTSERPIVSASYKMDICSKIILQRLRSHLKILIGMASNICVKRQIKQLKLTRLVELSNRRCLPHLSKWCMTWMQEKGSWVGSW
jgi:hypothetical protein